MGNTYPISDKNASTRGSIRVAPRTPSYDSRTEAAIQRSARTVLSLTPLAPLTPPVSIAIPISEPIEPTPVIPAPLPEPVIRLEYTSMPKAAIVQPRVKPLAKPPLPQPSNVTSFGITRPRPLVIQPMEQPLPIIKKRRNIAKELSKTTNKALLLSRSIESSRKEKKVTLKTLKQNPKHYFKRFIRKDVAVGLMVALILTVTGYVSFDTWQTNNTVKQNLNPSVAAASADTTEHIQANEGQDKSPLPKNALANYKVSAELPRAIYIKKLGVAARLLPMGVNGDSSLQAPLNINDAGWYTSSAKPGQGGAMVVDGHASQTGTNYGLFAKLDTLVEGDQLIVEKGDGTKLTYKVVHTEIDAESDVDMNKLMLPYGTATQGLNLITCAGEWTKDGKTLDHRVLVFTTLVQS